MARNPARPAHSAAETDRQRLAGLAPAVPVRVDAPGILRTDRLVLRPLSEGDRDEFLRVVRLSRADLDAFAPLHLPEESDERMFARQLELTRRGEEAGTALRRVGVLGDGSIAGAFNLNTISRGLSWSADLNWWVASDLAGRGLATEGVRALADFALADLPAGLGLHEVRVFIQRQNAASIRVADKAGFARQGDERSYIQTGEHWHIHDLYSRRLAAG